MLRSGFVAFIAFTSTVAFGQSIGVFVNGEPVRFAGIGPQKIDGRVLVPLRGVMEKLGAYVSYQASTKTVSATRGDVDIQLTLGQRRAVVNGREVMLDVPAMEFRGSTLVPLRFMGEALGADVKWDGATSAVQIMASGGTAPPTGGTIPNPVSVQIDSFDVQMDGAVRAGSVIEFSLSGTSGGEATVQIPGVVKDLALKESRRGVYTGSYTVPNINKTALTISRATPIAKLRIGSEERLIQAGTSFPIDNQPPDISATTPSDNTRVSQLKPNITAVFDDLNGSGIDINSVRLTLDGREVTNDATVTEKLLAYRPSEVLSPGKHDVEVLVRDRAGNRAAKTWSFNVVDKANVVTSFKHDAPQSIQPGDEITFTLLGEPKANVSLQLGDLKTMAMEETAAGKYVAAYVVRRSDRLEGLVAKATVRTKSGESYTTDLTIGAKVASNAPLAAPKITSHEDGDKVAGKAVFKGKADPGAKVQIRIEFSQRVFGAIPMKGVIGDIEITANDKGVWESQEIDLDTGLGRSNITYTVTAVTVGEGDKRSEAVKISLKR